MAMTDNYRHSFPENIHFFATLSFLGPFYLVKVCDLN